MDEISEELKKKIIAAFDDKEFQNQVAIDRNEIEKELNGFMTWMAEQLRPEQKVFRSLESRLKSTVSFRDKIVRRDYIHRWKVTDDISEVQAEIRRNLTDLIGFRITCFFMNDEVWIYEKLREYYEKVGGLQRITLDFTENKKQKNGRTIYKVSGVYNESTSFELQIKSLVHNIWGEVEHKTIYKGVQYDINAEKQKEITDSLYDILKATDRQLLTLYTNGHDEETLIKALFAKQTQNEVACDCGINYLARHYINFFNMFWPTGRNTIKKYISKRLEGSKVFDAVEVSLPCTEVEFEEEIAKNIKLNFGEYYLNPIFSIAKIIYRFDSFNAFLHYLARLAICCVPDRISDDELIVEDAFGADPDIPDTEYSNDRKAEVLEILKNNLHDAWRGED